MKKIVLFCAMASAALTCFGFKQKPENDMYFPPVGSSNWETVSMASLGWNETAVQPLYDFLKEKNTKAFIILVNGRIAAEKYFNGGGPRKPWYWASAGKTLTATVFGIAQQEGYVNIDEKVTTYLGKGWTSVPPDKENLITCRHLLTMTSGLADGDNEVTPEKLTYKADAGTRWAYHNAYVKLQDVIAAATKQSWEEYFNQSLKEKIGMTGAWTNLGKHDVFSVYWSNARSMARFGLLALNKGNWNGTQVVNEAYFTDAVNTSQELNKSYGYLWWLNGKENFRLPTTQMDFKGPLIPDAPADMYAALGKNDQKIYVIPSRNMVIIRLGNAAEGKNFAKSGFDNNLWKKINDVIK
ncbi:serine hydrolase domain-containing protein [Flavobacterium sp. RHBU_3]|uniref:serine hydrolase domain-containing protein n=1 Tax=Flavobacterium sp. RHBU_3 TaxID=3391184 RepID=UPI003985004C